MTLDVRADNGSPDQKSELPELLEKFIIMNDHTALMAGVTLNPFFLYRMRSEFPELAKAGYTISITDSDYSDKGREIRGAISKGNHNISLGSIWIRTDGKVEPGAGLKPYTDLIRFVQDVERKYSY